MNVIQHTALPRIADAGRCRQRVAGAAIGALPFGVECVWLEAGASIAEPAAAGRRAVIVLAGSGKLRLDSGSQDFQGPCTLVVPAGDAHSIVNHGAMPLQLVCVGAPEPAAP